MAADVASLLDWRSILIAALTVTVWLHYIRKKKTTPLPPGPRGLPFVGNVLDLPPSHHWLKFAEIGDIWGDIFSLTVFGQTMVVVNSVKVAEDLLDLQGANFSDRPVLPMAGELVGYNNGLALCHYGDRTRKERKLFHQLVGTPAAIKQLVPLLSTEIHKLLRNIVSNPGGLSEEIGRTTAAIILRIAYGYHLQDGPEPDPYLRMFETIGKNFSKSTTPAAFLVDLIPVLRYWPEWLPGGGFHTTAKMWSKQAHDTAAGTAEPSFVSALLDEQRHEDYLIKWAAASIEIGGRDTAAAQLEAFFLAMSLYPDVQVAAQEELDRVVGHDRLPDNSDRAELPYVLRWHVAAPLAVPHRTREDYIYERGGVIPNIWKMAHDPERYANPMAFDPTRFIGTDGKEPEQNPASICFGYGRKLLGETAVFMECSAILSVFNISKASENGIVVEPQLGQTSTTVSRVLPFKCVVKPRNARALALIQSE
ncbi:cytochrome P450 [Mycena leptocephala]|nr:cytochrome P450 [Mycena leptocephala]